MHSLNSPKKDYKNFAKQLSDNENKIQFTLTLDAFYKTFKPKRNEGIKNFGDILKKSFVLGEKHDETAAKKFLIKNMELLKNSGFDTLFMEGINYEDQEELDNYFLNQHNTEIELKLSSRLTYLDNKNKLTHTPYNFSGIVKAAKLAGIRIVGIETAFGISSVTDSGVLNQPYRRKSLNFFAYHIIDAEKQGSWFALVGAGHVARLDCLGIANLTDANSIIAYNSEIFFNRRNEINFDQMHKISGYDTFVDMHILYNSSIEPPFISSPDILNQEQTNFAIRNYISYRNNLFNFSWITANQGADELIKELKNTTSNTKRFFIACRFISTNPDNKLAEELRKVCWEAHTNKKYK